MGFNFRKRIKLGKYINLNLSKSGPSLSIGKKGMRQSINMKGVGRTTLSIPGTGLYYTKTLSAKPLLKKLGQKEFFKDQEYDLPAEEEVKQFHEDLKFLMNLHQEADYDQNINWEKVQKENPPFVKGQAGPFELETQALLKEKSGGFFKKLFQNKQKNEISEKMLIQAQKKDLLLYKAYENMQILAAKLKTGTREDYLNVLEELKLSDLLGSYVESMDFSYTDEDSLKVDLVLAVEDFIPEEYKTLTPTGKLSVKTYTKTDYYQVASQFIAGLTLKTARNLFHLLPSEDMFINVFEVKEDELSQRQENSLILSVFIKRQQLEEVKTFAVDPFELVTEFPHEVKFVKTRGFKEISPLDNMFHQ